VRLLRRASARYLGSPPGAARVVGGRGGARVWRWCSRSISRHRAPAPASASPRRRCPGARRTASRARPGSSTRRSSCACARSWACGRRLPSWRDTPRRRCCPARPSASSASIRSRRGRSAPFVAGGSRRLRGGWSVRRSTSAAFVTTRGGVVLSAPTTAARRGGSRGTRCPVLVGGVAVAASRGRHAGSRRPAHPRRPLRRAAHGRVGRAGGARRGRRAHARRSGALRRRPEADEQLLSSIGGDASRPVSIGRGGRHADRGDGRHDRRVRREPDRAEPARADLRHVPDLQRGDVLGGAAA
jgi:hypothetical protein